MNFFGRIRIAAGLLFAVSACSHPQPVKRAGEPAENSSAVVGVTGSYSQAAWIESAKGAYRSGNFIRATRLLETAFVLDPQGPDLAANHLLYYLYLAQADYPRALLLAKSLVKKHPYRAQSYYHVGLAELWSGDARAASQNFLRAVEFADAPARTHFYLGLAHSRLGDEKQMAKSFQNAEREYRRILKNNPNDFAANFELAHLYLFWDVSWQKAEALVQQARKHLRKDVETTLDTAMYRNHYLSLIQGMYLTHKGQPQQALQALWEALANAPDGARADTAEIYYYLGTNFAATRADAQARNFFKKAALLDPTGPYALKTESALRNLASTSPRNRRAN